MLRRDFNRLVGALTVGPALTSAGPLIAPLGAAEPARRWTLRASIAECCSCAIPCSCNFGRPEGTCFGNRLIQIREGNLDGADLAGLSFVVTFHMGRWTRIYLDDALPTARVATLEALLPVAFAGFDRVARTKERVRLDVQEGADRFSFSVPESRVEMKLLPGLGGSPIRVTGLPNPAYHDYVQHESVVHTHQSADGDWSYSGTNGFRSEMRVSG
jgi:hypothetical protein